jgi:hypothetical protein
MWDGRQLRTIPRGIVVQLEEWDREEFHIFWDSEDFCSSIEKRVLAHVYLVMVWDALRSGICTRNSFLHSFGLVMWAGMNGY